MFVFANFLMGVAKVLDMGLSVYLWLVLIRAVLSWVNPDPYNPIVQFLNRATDPVIYWVRRRIPTVFGGLDFAPLLIVMAIYFLQIFLVRSLMQFAAGL